MNSSKIPKATKTINIIYMLAKKFVRLKESVNPRIKKLPKNATKLKITGIKNIFFKYGLEFSPR